RPRSRVAADKRRPRTSRALRSATAPDRVASSIQTPCHDEVPRFAFPSLLAAPTATRRLGCAMVERNLRNEPFLLGESAKHQDRGRFAAREYLRRNTPRLVQLSSALGNGLKLRL